MGIELQLERYDVQILGHQFQYEGQLEPIGQALDFLNSGDRTTYPLYDVTPHPIVPSGPLKGVTRPEITVSGSELGLVFFCDADYRQRIPRLRNTEGVIAYTPHVVLRGNFHRGAEARLRDLLDTIQGTFLVMSDVSVFPIARLPAPFPQQADLLIVNRQFISLYHPE
jgi:hypothetical protein